MITRASLVVLMFALNADFRIDSTNPINHVGFPSWNTALGSAQFGLPSTANGMRTLAMTFIVRF